MFGREPLHKMPTHGLRMNRPRARQRLPSDPTDSDIRSRFFGLRSREQIPLLHSGKLM